MTLRRVLELAWRLLSFVAESFRGELSEQLSNRSAHLVSFSFDELCQWRIEEDSYSMLDGF